MEFVMFHLEKMQIIALETAWTIAEMEFAQEQTQESIVMLIAQQLEGLALKAAMVKLGGALVMQLEIQLLIHQYAIIWAAKLAAQQHHAHHGLI